jgi:5-carboxymethyl-2-hydroxymuconate isomerase
MPLFNLKISSSIKTTVEFKTIFADLHTILVKTLDNAKLSSCKSWVETIEHTYVGDGSNPQDALIFLSIRFFNGRPVEQRGSLAEQVLAYLRSVYSDPNIHIVVDVSELNRDTCAIG